MYIQVIEQVKAMDCTIYKGFRFSARFSCFGGFSHTELEKISIETMISSKVPMFLLFFSVLGRFLRFFM